MKEGSPGDLSYVMVEGEVIIKDDSKVAAVGGWRQGGVVDGEAETVCGFGAGFGADDDQVGFVTVEFEEVGLHPGFDIGEAVGEGGVSGGGDGVGGDIELDVIGITVEMETMVANDVAKGEQVEYEEERTKYRTLGDALGQRNSGGGAVVDVDELLSVCEIRFQPGECSASDVEGGLKAGKKNGVVDGVECCSEVQEDEDGEVAGVCREEDVVGDFQEGCFSAVLGTETGLKWFEQVI